MREWEWEGMGINIFLREGMGMFLCTTMGMEWEWEYGHGNGREWDRKSHSHTSLTHTQLKTALNLDSNKVTEVLRRTNQKYLISSVKDSSMLKEFMEILEPFVDATELKQGEKYRTI